MNDRPSHQKLVPRRKFVPDLNPLERRCLLSAGLRSLRAHPNVPTHGGIAVQTGSLLTVTVDRPTTNRVQVSSSGADIQLAWNGAPVENFTDVAVIEVHAEKARNNQITFNLGRSVANSSNARACTVTSDGSGTAVAKSRSRLTSVIRAGTAIQQGTKLIVTVDRPTTNNVEVIGQGAGRVDVAWNGSPEQSFSGITTVVAHTEKARNDQLSLSWATS